LAGVAPAARGRGSDKDWRALWSFAPLRDAINRGEHQGRNEWLQTGIGNDAIQFRCHWHEFARQYIAAKLPTAG
jgi:hypothetical protein